MVVLPRLVSSDEKKRRIGTVSETEEKILRRFGVSLSEVMQGLVLDNVLREAEGRELHRILVEDRNVEICDALLRLGGSRSQRSVQEFRESIFGRRRMRVVRGERARMILVSRGRFNPIHKMHLRHLKMARRYLEERTGFRVAQGVLVPKHSTEVRERCRQRPREIIPPRHRLAMARAAVDSSWITVSPCEIARRRILDYVTTLDGIRQNGTLVVFLVAADELVRLDLPEICDAGHQCITICRPQEHERLKAQLGSRWRRVAHVVEDLALLSAEYEAATSTKIRKDLLLIGRGDCNRHQTTTTKTLSLLPDAVRHYIFRNRIAQKMAGAEKWTKSDRETPTA